MQTPGSGGSYRDVRYTRDAARPGVWQAIIGDLSRRGFIDAPRCVVDLGAGYGDFVNNVEAPRRVAVDMEDCHEDLALGVEFHLGPADELGFLGDGEADVVMASNLLEHLETGQVEKVLAEVRRVLGAEGRFLIIQPNFRLCAKSYFDDYTHRTVFTDESLVGLLESRGFTVEYRKAGYLPFSMRSRLPKARWLVRLYLTLGSPILGRQMLVVARRAADV